MNIIYIGVNGFPHGLATIQRQILIAKGLIEQGASCKVISRFGINEDKNQKRKDVYDGIIPFEISAPIPYREKNILKRNINKFIGFVLEFKLFIKYHKKNEYNILLGVRSPLLKTFYYRLISLLLGYKYIIDVNELLGVDEKKFNLNHYIFNLFSSRLCDGMILISDYLIDFYKSRKPTLNYVKAPIICDVNYINSIKPIVNVENYFLYCSSVSYIESIFFVIDAFRKVNNNVELKLIISGDKIKLKKVEDYINKISKSSLISLESNISYIKLLSYYKKAKGLLIPLPETIQHKARFPHKIGEYASSKSAIITNNWGEIPNYFNKTNAFIADRYNIDDFAYQMEQCVISNNNKLVDKAYAIALNNFNYKVVTDKILHLIKDINNEN